MPASFVAAANDPTSGDSQTTSKSVDKPAEVVANDLGVFFLTFWNFTGTITAPTGAVQRASTTNGTERTVTYLMYVGSETSYTFSWSGSQWSDLKAQFFAGVDQGLDLAAVPFDSATGSGTSFSTTTVTTVADAALAWSGNTQDYGGATTHEPPTNYTETGDTFGSAAAYRISPGDGSQSASGATTDPGVNNLAALLALAPEAAGGTPIGRVTETDTARAWSAVKATTLGRITETDTARTLAGGKTKTLGRVTETDTARSLGAAKAREIGQVTETDTARLFTVAGGTEIGRVTETDTARSLTASKTKAIGRVTEADTARAPGAEKASTFGRVTETGTARTFTVQGDTTIGRVVETDQARTWTGAKTKAIGRVTEAGTARGLTAVKVITIGRVAETATPRAFTGAKAKAFGRVVETDTARAFVVGEPPPIPDVLTLTAIADARTLTVVADKLTLAAVPGRLNLTALED